MTKKNYDPIDKETEVTLEEIAALAGTSRQAPQIKKLFHCPSCGRDQPVDQIGKIIPGSHSKRCITCCDNADIARAKLIKKGA